jgi:uncharacterized protein (TIRG00374 family)
MALDVRATVAGFLGAVVVLAVLAVVVGVGELLSTLSMARPPLVGAVLVAASLWLFAWALALRTVLDALDAHISVLQSVAVYAGVLFSNNVTPFGQAGGEPVSALLISEAAETEYETALASIASADALNFVPSTALSLVGVAYFSVAATAGTEALQWAAAAAIGLAVALPVVGFLGWRNRGQLETAIGRAVTPIARAVGRYVPRVDPPERTAVERRVGGFFESIEAVATDRSTLLAALGLSSLGWLAQASALWLSLYALGVTAPIAAVLVAVPVGAMASVTPLPGGLGGIEAALVALLVPLAGVSGATAAAAVVLHRGAIYWLPTLLGGGVASALGVGRV